MPEGSCGKPALILRFKESSKAGRKLLNPGNSYIPTGIVSVLGDLFFFRDHRAARVTAFAGDLHFFRSRIPAKVAAIFFASGHYTRTRNVRTGILLKVFHKVLLHR